LFFAVAGSAPRSRPLTTAAASAIVSASSLPGCATGKRQRGDTEGKSDETGNHAHES
jgi:hypothetical protein